MTDLFCGAGGSSTGAAMAGIDVRVAVNHWPEAVSSHQANHPDTEHRVADISQISPASLPDSDILWASPSCVGHSSANQVKDSLEAARSRATAWDVLRLAEHRVDRGRPYRAICVENVVEYSSWRFYPQWISMLDQLGYAHRLIHLNSAWANMNGPAAPQLRDRLYVVAWHRSEKAMDTDAWLRPHATCPEHGRVRARQEYYTPRESWAFKGVAGVSAGKYRFQYHLTCPECGQSATADSPVAGDVLDWHNAGERVLARGRDLSEKTRTRIKAGIAKTASVYEPGDLGGFSMRNNGSRGSGSEHCTPLSEPLRTLTTAGHQSVVSYTKASSMRSMLASARTRLLTVREIAAACGFPDDYQLVGTDSQKRMMLGNAVTPPAARDLLTMVRGHLEGRETATAA